MIQSEKQDSCHFKEPYSVSTMKITKRPSAPTHGSHSPLLQESVAKTLVAAHMDPEQFMTQQLKDIPSPEGYTPF